MENDNRKTITSDIFGEARFIKFFRNGRQVKNERNRNEVFFSIEKRNGERKHGYMRVTNAMTEIFNTLFQDRRYNMHIDFIEWEDSYNVVFEDGMYISQKMLRMEKSEFEILYKRIIPVN